MTSSRKKRCAIRAYLLTATACLVALTTTSAASAAGLLIADGGFGGVLEIKEHVVKVTINNGVAVTVVDQVFVNTENREVEALYTFPVPKGASVSNFSMWIGGREMIGEVVENERARQIYNSYKRERRDPGLLEQVDYKTFEMRIYPIPAGAEQRVRVSYYQQLDFDHDTATYVYPLATATRANIDQRTTGRFAFTMRVLSEIPIASMDSPSHKRDVVVAKHTNKFHEASYEADGGSLARDVVIAYQTTRPKTGFDVITSRPGGATGGGGGGDGYFMMTVTAGDELERIDQAMDYVFVLDISGSMANDNKLITSKNAIRSFIDSLGVDDRFDVVTFNVEPTMLFKQLFNANPHTKGTAADFLDARGGTTLAPAMSAAYRYGDPDRPLNVVILSDGMTEQGEHNELKQLIKQRPPNTTVFAIGVGNEVNRPLLSQLTKEAGGLAAFISRGDDFERQARAFRRKLMRPAVSNLQMNAAGVELYDMEPRELPNLFHGSPVRMFGRYRGGGSAAVTVSGDVRGKAFSMTQQLAFPRNDAGNSEIERMWAWHRVQRLLQQDNSSLRNEIVRLGELYSIVTPHTSFLVLENNAEYQRWQIDRRNALQIDRDRARQKELDDQLAKLRAQAFASNAPQQQKHKSTPTKPKQKFKPHTGATPEPSTIILTLMGAGGLLLKRRRQPQ